MSLERGAISELLEILKTDIDFRREVQVRANTQRVHFVMRLRLFRRDRRAGFVSSLPRVVSHQP